MDHKSHSRLRNNELSSEILTGATVYGSGDVIIGMVSQVYGLGDTSRVVIDVDGFLEIGAKPVTALIRDLAFVRDDGGEVHAVTSWSREHVEEMPKYRAG